MFEYGPLPYQPVLPTMWAAVVAEAGPRDFVVSLAEGGRTERISYADADLRSGDMAARLIASGVTKGDRIGILAPNGPDFVVAFLAATRIGAVAVPINTFYQPPEVAWLVRHADLHAILAVRELLGRSVLDRLRAGLAGLAAAGTGPLMLPSAPNLRLVLPLDGGDEPWPSRWAEPADRAMVAACEGAVRPADDLFVIYTSGSTADPKGIIHAHGPAIRHTHFLASEHGWTADDRVYVPMAFFWTGGLVYGVLGPMQLGLTILTEHRFEPGGVLGLLEGERATYTTGFPHVGPALANDPAFARTDLSSVRDGYQQVLLPPARRSPDPTLRVAQLGMTETCSAHTWWPPAEELPESKRGSVGVPAPGFEHKVVGSDGATLPDGEAGELCVRGDALMRGMVGRLWNEVVDADGWYHTGDAVRRDSDGHLYFAGRTDDMIKTSGANVAPIEVESVLGSLPEVRVAYVVGLADEAKGAVVAAAVVLNEGAAATPDELVAACRARLAAYKVPKRWAIYPNADAIPYTTTNKIDKRRLADLLRQELTPEPDLALPR